MCLNYYSKSLSRPPLPLVCPNCRRFIENLVDARFHNSPRDFSTLPPTLLCVHNVICQAFPLQFPVSLDEKWYARKRKERRKTDMPFPGAFDNFLSWWGWEFERDYWSHLASGLLRTHHVWWGSVSECNLRKSHMGVPHIFFRLYGKVSTVLQLEVLICHTLTFVTPKTCDVILLSWGTFLFRYCQSKYFHFLCFVKFMQAIIQTWCNRASHNIKRLQGSTN